ncbi:hypothetical protein RJ639_046656 [Escallonia herrerae]|uniref:Uncharacterized protein n=1 Tax=Escallonia herrerae TaxID=1293975 RepID=A0AA88W855_9ASTE|nr:hypothetical protein RJ639_046656 [Escallonia herrerae]
MDDTIYVPENILQPLFSASKTSSLPKALESLIKIARGTVGRSELASKNVLPTDRANGIASLGNISLAGKEHQHKHAVWHQFFPLEFAKIARVRSRDTCDPLCMITVGFTENWLKLLISRSCLEDSHSGPLFSKLCHAGASGNGDDVRSRVDSFVPEQAFFLSILSEILNEQMRNIAVSNDFALFVLEVFRSSARIVESVLQVKSGLPTGSADIDVLGYSLTILRDICACDGVMGKNEGSMDTVDLLLSSGLLELH